MDGIESVYDHDPNENRRQTSEVARWLVQRIGTSPADANTLAILGSLPTTSGQPLRQTAQSGRPGQSFASLRSLALGGRATRMANGSIGLEEAFARLAALGYDPSVAPVAFHCPENGCHGRAQIMIDTLMQLGVLTGEIRRLWAFSERASHGPLAPKLRPTREDGSPLTAYSGAVEWDYHVAPAVFVEGANQTQRLLVIDPSLFRFPVEPHEWHQRTGTPLLPLSNQITALGVAPLDPRTGQPFPGSGYRPWADPVGLSPSQDARSLLDLLMGTDLALNRPARPLLSL